MAERRMFAKTIIDSDAFLDMPLSTQALYFHLSMRADDEGFVNNPKKIARMIGADDDSLRILCSKQYLIPFESGVVVIKHWKIHNYIRGDRLTETSYKQEKSMLSIDENGAYSILDDIKEIQELDSGDKRKLAYQNSTLPYSFAYKIKRAFEGKTCPMCGCKMSSSNKRAMPTIQHNKPISDGGEHELHNISVICLSCNTSTQNQETGELNNSEVIEMWDKIVYADKHKIKWFFDLSLLEDVYEKEMSDTCLTSDGQVTDKCLTQVRLGKDSIDKNSKDKNSKDKDSIDNNTQGTKSPTRKRFIPPTVEEVKEYCEKRNNNVNPEHFVNYYTSNGWKVGKNSMKDWKAAVRTWEQNGYNSKSTNKKAEELNDFYKMTSDWAKEGEEDG